MNPELQKAQDLIAAIELQRNKALAELAHAHHELMVARRRIAALEAGHDSESRSAPPSPRQIASAA